VRYRIRKNRNNKRNLITLLVLTVCFPIIVKSQNINDIDKVINVPQMVAEKPGAGKRVKQTIKKFGADDVYHSLYLPKN